MGAPLASLINAGWIAGGNTIYRMIAVALTNWENHRTNTEWDRAGGGSLEPRNRSSSSLGVASGGGPTSATSNSSAMVYLSERVNG